LPVHLGKQHIFVVCENPYCVSITSSLGKSNHRIQFSLGCIKQSYVPLRTTFILQSSSRRPHSISNVRTPQQSLNLRTRSVERLRVSVSIDRTCRADSGTYPVIETILESTRISYSKTLYDSSLLSGLPLSQYLASRSPKRPRLRSRATRYAGRILSHIHEC
jgi:hypothetical protein